MVELSFLHQARYQTVLPSQFGLQPFIQLTWSRSLFWRLFRGCLLSKTKKITIYNNINVFRKPIDEIPAFGKRRSTFKSQVFPPFREIEELTERPANPEVFFDYPGRKASGISSLFVIEYLFGRGESYEIIHDSPPPRLPETIVSLSPRSMRGHTGHAFVSQESLFDSIRFGFYSARDRRHYLFQDRQVPE